jgi:hypothetical protein
MARNSRSTIRKTSISKATTLREIGEYWDTHEFIPPRKTVRNTVRYRVYHVMPHKEKGWKVVPEGVRKRIAGSFLTKAAAISKARQVLKSAGPGRLVIHRGDGTVHVTHFYRADSSGPKSRGLQVRSGRG